MYVLGLPPCPATRTMQKESAIGGWRVAFVA
jgi:ribosome modulation factor